VEFTAYESKLMKISIALTYHLRHMAHVAVLHLTHN